MTRTSMAVAVWSLVGIVASGAHAQVKGAGATERFVLSGVILYEGGGLAWLQEPSLTGDRTVAVRLSDSIGPYRLTKIKDDRVELEGPNGTVLVPVFNAQAGSGSAVALASPGPASPGMARPQGRGMAPGVVPPQPVPAQIESPGVQAMRDRLDVTRRRAEQLQNAGSPSGQQPGQASAPEAPVGRRGAGSSNAAISAQGGSTSSQGGNASGGTGMSGGGSSTSGQGSSTSDVVTVPKGQTFQSILGLK